MNCVELFKQRALERQTQMAIQIARGEAVSFSELLQLGAKAQRLYRRNGLQAGDSVLLADQLSPRLYASIIAILASGATAVLVEPWMPLERINRVVKMAQPKIFSAGLFGRLWGLRSSAIRDIPKWLNPGSISAESPSELEIESVPADTMGILTFTSGTTGDPKGVVRGQGYLLEQHRVLSRALHLEEYKAPDLCIFANFALANLSSGRGSIIVPSRWKKKDLQWLSHLHGDNAPDSLTTGPAFLLRLMREARLTSLKSLHVGGALTDNWIFEESFLKFPEAHVLHIYGSSEAEPVAISDAAQAVRLSRSKGYFQTLYLGQPVMEINSTIEADNVWVSGPHVCPLYLGGEEENRRNKRRDSAGTVWHSMGDRVEQDHEGWWYKGRSHQPRLEFELEQKIYSTLESSKSFISRSSRGELELSIDLSGLNRTLVEEKLKSLPEWSRIQRVFEVSIQRDHRHRARIDRAKTLKTRKPWPIG